MPSSVTRLSALDHDRISRLVRRAVAPGPSQERWRDEVVRLVRAHITAETAVLTRDVVAAGGEEVLAAWEHQRQLAAELRQVADEIGSAPVGEADLRPPGERLQRVLSVYADVLCEQVLRPLEKAVPRKEIRRLGGQYADRRDQELRAAGEAEPPPRRLDLSRAELYELAKKAGIEGRSSMSRQSLIAELMRRQEGRR